MGKQNRVVFAMSRRRRSVLVCVCVAAAVLGAWADRCLVWQEQRGRADTSVSRQIRDRRLYDGRTFTIARVLDGDTVDIDFPDGENRHTRVRLLGIDTPETTGEDGPDYFGKEATQAATDLADGKEVRIYLDKDGRSRGYYGRLLAYVQLPDGRFLNEVLLSEGLAYADLRFRHSHYNRYKQLEAGARTVGKGLWAGVSRQQLPQWLQKEKPTLLCE